MPQRDVGDKRLDISEFVSSSGCVPNMTDRVVARELIEVKVAKDIRYKPQPLVKEEVWVIISISLYRNDASALLSSVLLSV
jgi:hypothetical protein